MSNDTFLPLPANFGGRVAIRPNGTNSVFVDGQSNSANGNDDDPRVCFITYRGKDYSHSANWQRTSGGQWVPVSTGVSQRGSFGMSKAPRTYAAAIIEMIGDALVRWYDEANGGAALREAEVHQAEMAVSNAERDMADAQAALDAAARKLRDAQVRLRAANAARVHA